MIQQKHCILLLFLFVMLKTSGQELPPIINFMPEEYGADNQNWMVSQSEDGHIFIANNKGLLEYNGANWSLYPSPNETIIRSVKAIDDKIYTGCYRNFGYWQRNSLGTLDYTSLSESLQIELVEDEQFWNILRHNKWLLFQSLDRIVVLDSETNAVSFIEAENTLTKIFKTGDDIFFQVYGEGLYSIENGNKKLIADSEIAKNSRIIGLFALEGNYTFITERNGFYQLVASQLRKWESPVEDLLKESNIYSALQTKDGSIVLGSISNGVYHLSPKGELLQNLNQSNGLANNTVLSLFEDSSSNIWLGLDNGVDCINTKAPLRTYSDNKGLIGSTYASAIYQGQLYLGTNQGLFYKPISTNGDFELVEGTAGQVWNLKLINDELFCGHNSGTFLVDKGVATLISEVQGTWDIQQIERFPELLIQGNYDGLYILEKSSGNWKIRAKLAGFDLSAKQFELTSNNQIIVNHGYRGVYKLETDSALTKINNYSILKSVQKSDKSSLVKFNNDIYYSGKQGIFKYSENSAKFERDDKLSVIFENNEYISGELVADNNERMWAFTKSYLHYFTKEKLGNALRMDQISISQSVRNEVEGFENMTHYKDGHYIFGTSNGYLTIDSNLQPQQDYQIKLNQVVASSFSGENALLTIEEPGEFKSSENNFIFQFSVPQFTKYLITEYQYRLDGLNTEWSPWTTNARITIENLKFGDYQFQVRAKVNDEVTVNTATYDFTILKPWYITNKAFAVYALLGVLLFLGIHWFYKRHYRNQRARLLERTTNEMKLKELASQKEIFKLKNASLNNDIEARNRELAIATMNMITKNTTLNSIKEELKKLDYIAELKSVIKLIDRSIDNKEEWKFFEEAFNHADKDFFKKVKELHPNLTSNDLRICVYLRLNLSSKEIAPLLNISPRSVEIKRYRLRKKINLHRQEGLNNYFMNL